MQSLTPPTNYSNQPCNSIKMPDFADSFVTSFAYPRTGKRGVPQQFPRRLYEMLESESKLAALSPDHPRTISWSPSGKAFGINDVSLFTSQVLSKYFRTSKFSSFQRNLNLYGFTKVRRGPDADMYGHPSFLRGHAELLSQLRKCKSASARLRAATSSSSSSSGSDSDESSPSSPLVQKQSRFSKGSHPYHYEMGARDATSRITTNFAGPTSRLALLATVLESSAPMAINQTV